MIYNLEDELKIGGVAVAPGESKEIRLKLSESYGSTPVFMPVTVVRGALPGPAVFFTAAVHGDEINGVEIVRQLTYSLDPQRLRGAVVCVPIVNIPGFNNRSRYLPDGRDLNRSFPGDAQGSQAARVAHLVFSEIIKKCAFGIDFHTATNGRANMPHIRADVDDEEARRLAKAFGPNVILHGKGSRGSLRREATGAGVPTLVFEAGEAGRFERRTVRIGLEGALNVLAELKMLETERREPAYQVIVKTGEWVRADRGGIFNLTAEPGDLVYANDELGVISNPFGRELKSVRAPFTGLVVGVTVNPLVNPGSPICHIVKLDKTLPRVERALGREPKESVG
jgi:predicted deacylase